MEKAKFSQWAAASLSCLVLLGGCAALSGEQDLHERQEGNGTQEDANGAGDAESLEGAKGEDAPRSDARPADVTLADTRNDVAPDTSDGGSMGEDAPMEAEPPKCPDGMLDCGASGCVNSDVHNCGRCGYDCLYGSCSSSQCLAWSVATPSGGINGLASDGVNVVWIDTASKNILEKPVSGSGNPVSLAQPSVQPSFVGMANGVVAFVASNSSGTLSIWTATEGSANSGFEIGSFGDMSTVPAAYSFAISPSGNAAYTMLSAVATGATNIEKCTLGLTATCTNLAPAVISDVGGNGMVVNATDAFWTDFSGGNVSGTTLTSPTTTNVATGQNDPYVVAIDSTYVYFANLGANAFQIARALQVNPMPASPGSVLGNTTGTLNSLATDGKYVYYGGLSGTTKVGYVPVAGTVGQPLYNVGPSGSVPANALAAAGGAVYFYDSGDNTIRGIAAPP